MRIIEIDGKPVGYEEGDTCNRLVTDDTNISFQCDGTMIYRDVENCSCHINPPCYECTHNPLVCDGCGETIEE